MSASHARTLLVAAFVMGLAGDVLLRGDDLRLGGTLMLVLIVAGAIMALSFRAARDDAFRTGREQLVLLVSLLVAATGPVLRDDPLLFSIDLLSILGIGALVAWNAGGRRLADFQVDDALYATLTALRTALARAPRALRLGLSEPSGEDEKSARRKRRGDLLVGALFALPLIFVVAGLLGEADPVLGRWLSAWTSLISEETLGHLAAIAAISWAAAGWLWAVASGDAAKVGGPDLIRSDTAFARIAPSLYGLSGLLAIFLGLQARVLFGGIAYLAETSGLTVAEYARSGFFDLVAVSAVVLGVLLLAERLLDQEGASAARHFRVAGTLLLLLVSVLIISAVARMALYVQYFGLSADRLYALFAMLGIAMVLGWFGWTVLRGRRARFGPGLLVVTASWVLLLNIANPEVIVVRVNVARAVAGAPFDVPYHRKLSADALPALHDALQLLPAVPCVALRDALEQERRAGRHVPADWQSWSVPRSARRLASRDGARDGDRCGALAGALAAAGADRVPTPE